VSLITAGEQVHRTHRKGQLPAVMKQKNWHIDRVPLSNRLGEI
jgi:hypothetical protein